MQKSDPPSPKGAFGIHDVLFILFKHKWKILILSSLGFAASATVFVKREPIYQTEAKLLVKYVLARENVETNQSQMNMEGGIADHVINTEIEILNSGDVALAVTEVIGVDRLLPKSGGKATLADGAGTILANLEAGVLPGNNVIHLKYSNADKELSKQVLRELVKQYFAKHLEIHRNPAEYELVSTQTDEARARLKETEKQLDKLKTESHITSLADATGTLAAQRGNTQEELMKARAEIAEQEARMESLEKSAGIAKMSGGTMGNNGSTKSSDKDGDPAKQVPVHIITEYKTMLDLLAFLQKHDLELRIKFKPGNRLIALNEQQINETEAKRRALVAQYPELITAAAVLDRNSKDPQTTIVEDQAHLASINARVEVFTRRMEEIDKQFKEQYVIGAEIDVLEGKKKMEAEEYRNLDLKLKNAKIDVTLDPSRMPNITTVQQPSEPIKTYEKITNKLILGLAGAGVGMGVGLAFLIELLFDRRVKRPFEIQTRLQLPLLLSIPYIRQKDRGGFLLSHEPDVRRIDGYGDSSNLAVREKEVATASQRRANHFILPYSETIRDRIIFNFEVNNVTHKPKLVAVTGLSEGAGSSTIAAGLAKSFSEINGAKVLLVDLSSYHADENPMFGEIPRHSLNGALQLARNNKFKESAQNLYYASATARRDDTGLTTFSPLHLYELMPHLQASQYDYIIFDMPPIDQTSRTLTMAGLMDKVLLVLDAENTSRDGLKWGYSELVKGKADVSCIFNKTRTHAPGWLIGDG